MYGWDFSYKLMKHIISEEEFDEKEKFLRLIGYSTIRINRWKRKILVAINPIKQKRKK